MDEEKSDKRLDILTEIRETEMPGRGGAASPYAQIIYEYYAEIEELVGEGFAMVAICRYFQKKGVLASDADVHSFRRAFRRENLRRKRAGKSNESKRKSSSEKKEAVKQQEEKSHVPKAKEQKEIPVPQPTAKASTALQVNPDNTFAIRPIDPDDLPDFDKLT